VAAAAAAVAVGQVATAPATRPAGATTAAATGAATTGPATTTATTTTAPAAKISLSFKDAPLDAVLDYLAQTAGFAVVKEGPVDGRVTIQSKQAVSADEAVALVNAALKANGFTAIRDERVLRIAAREKAKKGNIPVHFGADPKEIAASDELVTQVIPIQNVNATKLREDLKPLLAPEADVTANEASNTIIITDVSSSIRRVALIIAGLDKHQAATSEMRVIALKYANAAQTVKLIETFFKAQAGGPAMTPEMQMRMQQQGQPVPPQKSGPDRHGQGVVTAADDRTNSVIIMGVPATLKQVEEMIGRLDSNPLPASEVRPFALKFAQAETTAKLINDLYKPPAPQNNDYPFFIRRFGGEEQSKDVKVNAVFDERTNTVIVTAPAEALKAVEATIKMLDASPMATGDLKVFQLKYADAWTVSKLIEDMFKPKDDSGPRFPFFIFSEGPQNQQAKGVRVNVTSDDRTNSLIVSAPTELLKVIEGMVEKLDANPASEDTLFIYHLRNGQSTNLEYVLNVLFGNVSAPGQNPQNQQVGPDGQPLQNRTGGRLNLNGDGANNGGNGMADSRGRSGTNRRTRSNQPGMPRLGAGAAKAFNELTGKVFVVADPDTNSLLVTTATKYKEQVKAIIDDLDRPVQQVLIKVLVAEVKHDNAADLGVDFSVINRRENGRGQTLGANFGNAALRGGLVVSVVEANLTATLHALAENDKLDVLSRPYLLASDNQLANILIGQSVPFVRDSRITESGQQINTVEYRDIGLSLNVTPHINPDGVVILDVMPEISQLTSQQVPISSTTFAPVIAKRSAESRIAVKDGQTVVIGGLMEDRKTLSVDKIPLLGDIPFVGEVFSRTQTTKTKTELLIFLTPHVAQRPESLQPMSEAEAGGTKLTPRAVAPGVFEEHMEGMRRGQSPDTRPVERQSPVNSIDLNAPPTPRPPAPDLLPPPQPPAEQPQRPSTDAPGRE
jgi:general secretion pathway protein D